MKKEEFNKRINEAEADYKTSSEGKILRPKLGKIVKTALFGFVAFALAGTMAFSLAGCSSPQQEGSTPPNLELELPEDNNENDKGEQEGEKDPNENAGENQGEQGENEGNGDNGGNQGGEQTPELTPAQKQEKMFSNVLTSLKPKIDIAIGSAATINDVVALDYENTPEGYHFIYLLLDNTTSLQKLDLLQFSVDSEVNETNLLENNIKTNKYGASKLITIDVNSFKQDLEKENAIYNKLKADSQLTSTSQAKVLGHMQLNSGVDSTLNRGATGISFYTINQNEIERTSYKIISDGNTKDFIAENLINGVKDTTYRKTITDNEYFKFTDNVSFNSEWLKEYENANENTQTLNIIQDNEVVATIENNKINWVKQEKEPELDY